MPRRRASTKGGSEGGQSAHRPPGASPGESSRPSRAPIDRPTRHHGKVHVVDVRCKECEFCVRFCPQEILEISNRYTPKGYRPVQVKPGREEDCIACRFCEDVCPEYAIFVVEEI